MAAKKILGWLVFGAVGLIVAAFLAMHSINLFSYVFPPDQQQWAWMGFGLTGLGAIGYLFMFLWLSKTAMQKVIAFAMMLICSVGEVVAAYFGMQIESWKKSGWTLTQEDVQMMLMVVGILAILHFIAIIVHFAGDKIVEMFRDEDGDGIANYRDPDYRPAQHNKPKQNQPRPRQQNQNGQHPNWELDPFLAELKLSRQQAEAIISNNGVQTADDFYNWLKAYGVESVSISRKNFARLFWQLKSQKVNP